MPKASPRARSKKYRKKVLFSEKRFVLKIKRKRIKRNDEKFYNVLYRRAFSLRASSEVICTQTFQLDNKHYEVK